MPYTIKHDPVLDIIELTLMGALTTESELCEMTSKAISLQKQTGAGRFLLDTNSSEVCLSSIALYDLANKQYAKEGLNRQSRMALILPTSVNARDAARFYETVCYNHGWNVKLCPDRQDAIAWLCGSAPHSRQRG